MSLRPIYLDFAAATPLDRRVFAAMEPYLLSDFYNPSALYQASRRVRHEYEDARHSIAKTIGVKQHEIIMTAGATESCNLAIRGVMTTYGGRVAVAGIEHQAVLDTAQQFDCDAIEVELSGLITAEAVRRSIREDTVLVSIGYINNELGTVQPLRDIAAVVHDERQKRLRSGSTWPLFLHTDASQAFGVVDCAVSRLGVDMMTLNAAKCYGPKQVGVLWSRPTIQLAPLIYGGGQESGLRSGSENVAGAIGCAMAMTLAHDERKAEAARLASLRDDLQRRLHAEIPAIVINGHPKRRAPHILHMSLEGLDGERAVLALDEHGVMAATGSACAAQRGARSHVLKAVGMSDESIDGSLRFSLGRTTTEEDIAEVADRIVNVLKKEHMR